MSKVLTIWVLDYHMSRILHVSFIDRLGLDCQNVSDFNLLIRVSQIPCINLMVVKSLVVCINPLEARVSRVSCINPLGVRLLHAPYIILMMVRVSHVSYINPLGDKAILRLIC